MQFLFTLLIISFGSSVFPQETKQKDSLIALELLKKNIINNNQSIKLNSNGLQLELNKKDALKIAKVALFSVYGKPYILKQKPFRVAKIDNYWILWGSKKKGYGGVFEIIINSKNGSIEYLSHGK